MIAETLISALGGGLLRMVPEVLAHFDKRMNESMSFQWQINS